MFIQQGRAAAQCIIITHAIAYTLTLNIMWSTKITSMIPVHILIII